MLSCIGWALEKDEAIRAKLSVGGSQLNRGDFNDVEKFITELIDKRG